MNIKQFFIPKKFRLVSYLRPIIPMIVLSFFFLIPNAILSDLIIYKKLTPFQVSFWLIPLIFVIMELAFIFIIIHFLSFGKEFLSKLFTVAIPLYIIHLIIWLLIKHGMKYKWLDITVQNSIPLLVLIFSVFAGFFHGNFFSYILEENKKKAMWYTAFEVFFIGISLAMAFTPIITEKYSLMKKLSFYGFFLAFIILNIPFYKMINKKYKSDFGITA
ncbi:MAG: hypothetical protein JW870_05945 [Candidatus Delongbacteria bacterium]|nr:hypothetical protein [Candidatus Delongbacteria bacterium]